MTNKFLTFDSILLTLKENFLAEIKSVKNEKEFGKLRGKFLGKSGEITKLTKRMGELPEDERRELGILLNKIKKEIEAEIEKKGRELEAPNDLLAKQGIDVTAPGIRPRVGQIHPVTQIIWELTEIFEKMGYQILEGPEIETDWYNFEALNIPQNHPARDLQDTFWLTNGMLPRTHTSAMQVRVMEKRQPPFKVAVPGWVYRCEREDATHASAFHNYEGFAVGENLSFADLKGTLYTFLQEVLGKETKLKFRAGYFPYVEPCAEISASCPRCSGEGCPSCGNSGWLEILGAGMIHPVVLRNAHIDPKKFSGFAFCPGPTRLAMIKYRTDDIRLFTNGDLRFLTQF